MENCIFCSIANGDAEKLLWSSGDIVAFADIHPAAPVHILVVPKRHIENLDQLDDAELAGRLLLAAREVAHARGVKGGWKLKVNNGSAVGQTVPHLHLHILGGKEMAE